MTDEPEPVGAEQIGSERVGAVTPRKRPALVFDDPLSSPGRDDSDTGWGGGSGSDSGSGRDEAWYRRETPPHHGG